MRTLSTVLLLVASAAWSADVDETVRSSYGAFMQGRYEDSASGWRYLAGLSVSGPRPEANEALALREDGKYEAALPLWIKASILEGADGFIWNQRAWTALSLGRLSDARSGFEKALDRSASTATQAEAQLGMGLVALVDEKPRAALEPLRRAAIAGPYAIAAAAQLTAETALSVGDKQTALTYFRQALDVDALNLEALRGLMLLLDRIGDNRAAWRAARRLLALDPADLDALKVLKHNQGFVIGDADAASGARRLSRPVLDGESTSPSLPISKRSIRVGLYGAPDGRPATMTRCYIIANAPFKVTSTAYGTLRDNGRAFDQWEVEFRPETGVVEVRDAARNILFVAKQPFTFVPDSPRGSVLIKSAKISEPLGVDVGDREERGDVSVIPNPWGFRLVQDVALELYLYGVVSMALPEGSPPEAYKAQAVASRTAATWSVGHRPNTLEGFDVLDDTSLQRTIGLSGELRAAADGVDATASLVLAEDGQVARVAQHEDSGGITENGRESGESGMERLVSASDSVKPFAGWGTPLDLERFAREAPAEGLFSEAAPTPSPASLRWVRVIAAQKLRERVSRRKDIGALRRVRVASRTSTGRVTALEIIGSRGSFLCTGREEIASVLSPGSLRSTLFVLQPLYDGKDLTRLLIWGAGTGAGLGMPRAGAVGQAALGRSWKEVLMTYFPRCAVRDLDHAHEAAPSAKAGRGPHKRTLNFRRPKK
ncbi:MAG: SpoIID/LytB domain-containing protein [Elusimicrobiota bacterium]